MRMKKYGELENIYASYEDRREGEDPDYLMNTLDIIENLIRKAGDGQNVPGDVATASNEVLTLYSVSRQEGFIEGLRYAVKLIIETAVI